MTKITVNVTDRKNKKHILEAQKGRTLMQLIDQHELANPYGICGGEPMCGTCHVYVEKKWLDKINFINRPAYLFIYCHSLSRERFIGFAYI